MDATGADRARAICSPRCRRVRDDPVGCPRARRRRIAIGDPSGGARFTDEYRRRTSPRMKIDRKLMRRRVFVGTLLIASSGTVIGAGTPPDAQAILAASDAVRNPARPF